jgi:glycosyl transferase family 1
MCNQMYKYQRDNLDLRYQMDWEQFGGRFDALKEIARSHREQFAEGATQSRLLMPFFCFHLPHKVLTDVGEFDESFDCGGEDVDYRLRTLLAGYDVVYAAQSYVLHFMGKSTWRSGESLGETIERDKKYFARFAEKWGDDAAAIFLASKKTQQRVNELGLKNLVDSGQFRLLAERCTSRRPNLASDSSPQRTPAPQIAGTLAKTRSTWAPQTPLAGTELMVEDLRKRLGSELDRINLQVNHPGSDKSDKRPRVVWMHHDINQTWVQWCKDKALVDSVDCFIFVSHWQREQYLNTFGLPAERCFVLRHALDPSAGLRRWEAGPTWRCAYTSTPFRGLSVLLDAWERLSPANAELHIWSSMKLYLLDDGPYEHLYKRAESMPGVIYHGIAPNHELRAALRDMHFLVYPCTFRETACLSVIEAMAAGCRVIVPSFGALPETTGGYARIYPSNPDPVAHAAAFAEVVASEFGSPWAGDVSLALAQQHHCAAVYDWPRRLGEWRHLIGFLNQSGIWGTRG